MTDNRELLELAAKAAGVKGAYVAGIKGTYVEDYGSGNYYYAGLTEGIEYEHPERGLIIWNPLYDDGDALRLAVKLGICVSPGTEVHRFTAATSTERILEERKPDPYAATRRAIVRAAAEIRRTM